MKKLALITLSGNVLSHYSTALFGLLAPVFAVQFFGQEDYIYSLILTYALIPLAMFVKPLGSLVFGSIGDRKGRGASLCLAFLGLSISSATIAFLPTYSALGWMAPALLALMKATQSFFSAGETCGGAVLVLEHTEEGRKDSMSALHGATTVLGILMASASVWLLFQRAEVGDSWRVLYLLPCLGIPIGLALRRVEPKLERPPERLRSLRHEIREMWTYRSAFFRIMLASGFTYANYMLALVLINGFVPLVSDVTRSQAMGGTTWMLLADIVFFVLFARLARLTSGAFVMLLSAILAVCLGPWLFSLFQGASFQKVLIVRLVLVAIGVAFAAPLPAWSVAQVPERHRYKIYSVAYAIGSQLLGAPCAAISLWCFHHTGLPSSAAWYWSGMGAVTLFSVGIPYLKEKMRGETQEPALQQ